MTITIGSILSVGSTLSLQLPKSILLILHTFSILLQSQSVAQMPNERKHISGTGKKKGKRTVNWSHELNYCTNKCLCCVQHKDRHIGFLKRAVLPNYSPKLMHQVLLQKTRDEGLASLLNLLFILPIRYIPSEYQSSAPTSTYNAEKISSSQPETKN